MKHSSICFSGTGAWNRCFCGGGNSLEDVGSEETIFYSCYCGKYRGTKQGLLTHQRMVHKERI